ncbi:MAG: hypothetical protein ABMA64_21460 [Myxococcota bacterium]
MVVGVALGAALACSGLGTPEAPPAPTGPTRTERSGEVVPASFAVWSWDGECHLDQVTVGAGTAPVRWASSGMPCPKSAFVSWTDSRLLFADEAGLMVDVADGLQGGPGEQVQLAVWVGDTLHACGKVDVEVKRSNNDVEADYGGRKLLGYAPPDAGEPFVAVHWVKSGEEWTEASAEIVSAKAADGPSWPACATINDWPKDVGFALSDGPRPASSDWTPAVVEDLPELSALAPGAWFVDTTRTVAAQGQPGPGKYAAYFGGKWQIVYPGTDARGLWVLDDFLAVRDGEGGLTVLSRRDGKLAYEQAAATLAMPWPEGGPAAPPTPAEAEEPEGEPEDPADPVESADPPMPTPRPSPTPRPTPVRPGDPSKVGKSGKAKAKAGKGGKAP